MASFGPMRRDRGLAGVLLVAATVLIVHLVTNHRYGFHRDELQVLDDARHLEWGYVVYPPLTPAIARVSLEIFGVSLAGFRLFAALAQSAIVVLAGLMARDLGGPPGSQILAAAMTAVAPLAVIQGALLQYVGFDYLWWVLIAWLTIRLVRSDDPRWWIAIGAAIGAGVMTRYTIGVFVAGVVAGVVFTPLRRHLRSPWLWAGVGVSVLIALPNMLWQLRHDFVTLEFLSSIHERDVRIGRTGNFLVEQLFVPASIFTIPWWIGGLRFYFFSSRGRPYRPLGWMYLVPLVLFVVMQGRGYYLAPAYPMLLAAGAVAWQGRTARLAGVAAVLCGAIFAGTVMLPVAPVNSPLWKFTARLHDNFAEQIGWPDLVDAVAAVHRELSPQERATAAILVTNYGQAGAINLYGPERGLPRAISGVNSHWGRGYGSPPPQTVIVLGMSQEQASRLFQQCEVRGEVTNSYGVSNEESREPNDILVCRGTREPWPRLWARLRSFG